MYQESGKISDSLLNMLCLWHYRFSLQTDTLCAQHKVRDEALSPFSNEAVISCLV